MGNLSLWLDERARPAVGHRQALSGDRETDVVVVGAGVAGLTAALELVRAGKKVVVLDAGTIGAGESQRTTSHLTEVLDQRFYEIAQSFDDETATLMARGQRVAIDHIERCVRDLGVDCGFDRRHAYLYAVAEDSEQHEALDRETEACQRLKLAAQRVDVVPEIPLRTGGALCFANQAQIIPGPYLSALAGQIEALGGLIFENTAVTSVDDSDRCEVTTQRGMVTADHVIVATNAPIHTKLQLHVSLENYRTYVVATPWASDRPLPLLWDFCDPYHYLRTQRIGDETYLIVGGEDHLVGEGPESEEPYARLRQYVAVNFGGGTITHQWSGQIVDTADGLPYIGPTRRGSRILVATGFSGNGYTNGTLSGLVLKDVIVGHPNPWADLLSPTRMPTLASVPEVVVHNLNVAKHFVTDRVAEKGSPETLNKGCGQILHVGSEKLAVYRDDSGRLHTMSPVCPHMGCYVQWNGAERSWDCPCHGSRFTAEGHVINGPAVKNLETRDVNPDDLQAPKTHG